MNNSLNNFIINFKNRLSNSMLVFSHQQKEQIYKLFLSENEQFKFHNYKAIIFILLSCSVMFVTNLNIISFSLENKKLIDFFSWLFIGLMTLDLLTNHIAYFFKKIKYNLYFTSINNEVTLEKLIDDFLNNKPKSDLYYKLSSYLRFEDFQANMSQDEVTRLLNIPLSLNQKQYLYDLISKKGIKLADLEHLLSIDNIETNKPKNLYLVK